jgi:iron complex transport system substrate-binding protein
MSSPVLVGPAYGAVSDTTRRQFLAIIGAAGLLSACSTSGSADAPAGPATRTVVHPLGTTEVPVAPARVVALDRRSTLPHLLALGVSPVGALTHHSIIGTDFPPVVADQVGDVAVVPTGGGADEPGLEAVAALRPDLLLGWSDGIEAVYPELSAIAPTVAIEMDFTDASVGLAAVARAVGREAEAEAVSAAFAQRLAEAHTAIGEFGTVSVVLSVGDRQFRVYGPEGSSVCRWIVEGGGRIAPDRASLPGEAYEDMFVTISPENLGLVTSDTVVVLFNTGASGEAALTELESSPLWPTLPAVRAGRVVRLNSQESVGQYGFQGYESVLAAMVAQWTALPQV